MSATAPVYIKHPASGGDWASDAGFMDAGTAHILTSNIAHLAEESVRPIGWALGPGVLERYQNGTWTTIIGINGITYHDALFEDASTVAPASNNAFTQIAWDYRTAHRFGPYVAIQDRALDAGGYGPRTVRVDVRCDAPASADLYLFAALTMGPEQPDQEAIAIATGAGTPTALSAVPATGLQTVSMTLSAVNPIPEGESWTCRADGTYGKTMITVAPLWLWVGWYRHGAGSAAVISVSAYEVR